MDRAIRLQETFILTAAGVLGIFAVIPYTLTLQPPLDSLEMPLSALLLIQVIQNTVLLGIVVVLGLELAHRCSLGAPFLEAWLENQPETRRLKAVAAPAFLQGTILSLVILVMERRFLSLIYPRRSGKLLMRPGDKVCWPRSTVASRRSCL